MDDDPGTSRRRAPRHGAVACFALVAVIACGSSGGKGGGTAPDAPASGASTPDPTDASPLASTGTIAYVRGNELRLVEPDGSNDHLVWRAPPVPGAPNLTYHVRAPAWRRDGQEIAFSSDHEEAFSIYASDIYAVRPDGKALRKLTNGPTRARQAAFPKGTVRVRVSNPSPDPGPYVVIALGADPQSDLIAPGTTKTFTFDGVADLGAGVQPVVAAAGGVRWFGGAAADVKAGQTVDAGLLTLSGGTALGAHDPFWRADGARVGFFTGECVLESTAAIPPPGWDFQPLVTASAFRQACGVEWGPTAATAAELLLADSSRGDGSIDILRAREGATARPAPLTSVKGFATPDLHWIPDGTGFYVVTQADIVEPFQIHRFDFGTGLLTRLTSADLGTDTVRRFSVAPDARRIAFERTDDVFELTSNRTDLWVMDRDGSNLRALAAGGRQPAWNPTRP
jgi:hypothetical protein